MSQQLTQLPLGNIKVSQDSDASEVAVSVTVPKELPLNSTDFWVGVFSISIGVYLVNQAIKATKTK